LREFTETATLEDVYFEFDESAIPPAGIQPLNANASWIKGHPDHMILIEGHCDDRGTNDYNLALGERRARSAMNYLVTQGVPATRIVIVSYGEERPACRAPTESCWSKNRRAHFLVNAQ
jgi:peptidoglycan-associated lipoprotein